MQDWNIPIVKSGLNSSRHCSWGKSSMFYKMTTSHIVSCNFCFVGLSINYWDKCCLLLVAGCSSYKYGPQLLLEMSRWYYNVNEEKSRRYNYNHSPKLISTSTTEKTVAASESKNKLVLSWVRRRYNPLQSIILQVYPIPLTSFSP